MAGAVRKLKRIDRVRFIKPESGKTPVLEPPRVVMVAPDDIAHSELIEKPGNVYQPVLFIPRGERGPMPDITTGPVEILPHDAEAVVQAEALEGGKVRLNFAIPAGRPGLNGVSPTVSIESVETLPAGSEAKVINAGDAHNIKLQIGLPVGTPGISPQVSIESVETIDAGKPAEIVNVGDARHMKLRIRLPGGSPGKPAQPPEFRGKNLKLEVKQGNKWVSLFDFRALIRQFPHDGGGGTGRRVPAGTGVPEVFIDGEPATLNFAPITIEGEQVYCMQVTPS